MRNNDLFSPCCCSAPECCLFDWAGATVRHMVWLQVLHFKSPHCCRHMGRGGGERPPTSLPTHSDSRQSRRPPHPPTPKKKHSPTVTPAQWPVLYAFPPPSPAAETSSGGGGVMALPRIPLHALALTEEFDGSTASSDASRIRRIQRLLSCARTPGLSCSSRSSTSSELNCVIDCCFSSSTFAIASYISARHVKGSIPIVSSNMPSKLAETR